MRKTFVLFAITALTVSQACKNKQRDARIVNDSRSAKVEKPAADVPKVMIDKGYMHEDKNTYRIKSVSIDGDILTINVTFKNGCNDSFKAISTGLFMKSLPPKVNVFLEHKRGSEPCEPSSEQTIKYDVSPLRYEGQAKVIININSPENQVEYIY